MIQLSRCLHEHDTLRNKGENALLFKCKCITTGKYFRIDTKTGENSASYFIYIYITLDRIPTAFGLKWFIFIQSDSFFTYWHQQNEILFNGLYKNPLPDELLVNITEFIVFNFYHGKLLVFSLYVVWLLARWHKSKHLWLHNNS